MRNRQFARAIGRRLFETSRLADRGPCGTRRHRKILAALVGVILVPLCAGATCENDTAETVMTTFLNEFAAVAADTIFDALWDL